MNCLVANYLEGQYHFGCEPKDCEYSQGAICDPNALCNACEFPIGKTGEKPLVTNGNYFDSIGNAPLGEFF